MTPQPAFSKGHFAKGNLDSAIAGLKGIFVTGTGTDVGKTYASAHVLSRLARQGKKVLYYKPIQCGEPHDALTVRGRVFAQTGKTPDTASTFVLRTPASPHHAFAQEGLEFNPNEIFRFLRRARAQYEFILMEGAGGIRVPIDDKNDMASLALLSELPALVVARPDLGTINHTLLTLGYLKERGVPCLGFIFSLFGQSLSDPQVASNAQTIETWSGLPFLGGVQ
jgi:dethiobiotin synthetase